MSKNKKSYIHKGLIVRSTDKAILIVIPHDISNSTWFAWLPKVMTREHDQNYLHYTYKKDKVFKLIQKKDINTPMNKWKNIKEIKASDFEELLEDYDTSILDEIVLINEIENGIETIDNTLTGLKARLLLIQEIENLPKEIDDIISEADLSQLNILVDNLTLAKERYKNG